MTAPATTPPPSPAPTAAPAPAGPVATPPLGRPPRFTPPRWLGRLGSRLLNVWAAFGLLYLFLPIFVIVLFSFNNPEGKFNIVWRGFTFKQWLHPFAVPELVDALRTSLKVAAISTIVATVLGTLVALALVRYRFRGGALLGLLLILPLTTPEVVMGSSLLSLFLDVHAHMGLTTIVIAHVMFCISFVALTVKARIRGFDWVLVDAAMDLGATPWRAFRKVTLPLIMPGVVAAALLAFALSLDDFIITFFNAGNVITFPVYVYGASQRGLPPQVNVIGTAILLASIISLAAGYMLSRFRATPVTTTVAEPT